MKKYLISFFAGILIFGLGVGISFAEVLSFDYKGEKVIGDYIGKTENHILQFNDNKITIIHDEDIKPFIIVDNNIRNNDAKIEITYNEGYQKLNIDKYESEAYIRLFKKPKYVQEILQSVQEDIKESNYYTYTDSSEKSKLKIYVNEYTRNKIMLVMQANF